MAKDSNYGGGGDYLTIEYFMENNLRDLKIFYLIIFFTGNKLTIKIDDTTKKNIFYNLKRFFIWEFMVALRLSNTFILVLQ